MLPLLIAYKIKFFVLVPVIIMGLLMMVKMAGMTGFFFAMMASVMGYKEYDHHHASYL